MVVDPPQAAVSEAPPAAAAAPEQLYVYPRNGQNDKQTADDRYRCHRWAVGQTGYDPTQPAGAPSAHKRSEYQRAMSACLDARGYTAR